MEIFYQVICENQDNVAWCFVHAANPFVVLTILVLTPKMPKTRCFLALKDLYYIPVFGLSKIFCIFCLGELVCWRSNPQNAKNKVLFGIKRPVLYSCFGAFKNFLYFLSW